MERDFMGLTSKESLPMVKEEMNNDTSSGKDSDFKISRVGKWNFLNKVSAHPLLMPFNASQDDKAKITSSEFLSISNLDAFDSTKKCSASELQKSFNHDRQGGIPFPLTPYPVQLDVNSVNRLHDMKMLSVSMKHSSLKNHFATVGQNMNDANVKQPPLLGGIPVTSPHPAIPIVGAVSRMKEPCISVKPSAPAPQLTIFYAGTVNVFNDISPHKAQAIMSLARSSLSTDPPSMSQLKVQAQGSKLVLGDGVPMSQPIKVSPSSGLSSPLSVSSQTGAQSGSGSSSNDEFLAAKPSGGPTTSISNAETAKVVNATTMLPSAVPQARKASLARFFEKRKERVINTAPYNLTKKNENVPHQNTMVSNITASSGALSTKQDGSHPFF